MLTVQGSLFYDDDFTTFDDLADMGFSFANIPEKFRDDFPDVITEVCHSTIRYDLDRSFESVHQEFHTLINCLFNDAFKTGPNRILTQVKDKTTKRGADDKTYLVDRPDGEVFSKNERCEDISIDEFQKTLTGKGYRTLCGEAGSYPTVLKPYSSCQVGEVVWTEFCGYQKYLWAKMRDDKTLSEEYKNTFGDAEKVGRISSWSALRKPYFDELKKTKRSLLDTIFLYQKFEQNFRLHVWFVILYDNLNDIRETLIDFRKTIETYPKKFPNAASPPV